MGVALDTSVLIELSRGNKRYIDSLEKHLTGARAAVPFFSYFEFITGIPRKSLRISNYLYSFIHSMEFLPPTQKTAFILRELKISTNRQGAGFTVPDLMIAAQAIEHDHTLLTADKQFSKVPGLRVVLVS